MPAAGQKQRKNAAPAPASGFNRLVRDSGIPLRAVIVEDEATVALDLQDTLTRYGASVVGVAGWGSAGLILVTQQRPDVAGLFNVVFVLRCRRLPLPRPSPSRRPDGGL